jgi:hypothetical protein
MTGYDILRTLREKAINERDKAKGSIFDARRRITDIEKEISFHEGERDVAEYILGYIERYMHDIENSESLTESL